MESKTSVPSICTRRSNNTMEDPTLDSILGCCSTVTITKSIMKKINSHISQMILAYAIQKQVIQTRSVVTAKAKKLDASSALLIFGRKAHGCLPFPMKKRMTFEKVGNNGHVKVQSSLENDSKDAKGAPIENISILKKGCQPNDIVELEHVPVMTSQPNGEHKQSEETELVGKSDAMKGAKSVTVTTDKPVVNCVFDGYLFNRIFGFIAKFSLGVPCKG